MKLYYHPATPNCRSVLFVAEHLHLTLEHEIVDLFKGEQKKPEFLKVNPNGKVPVLVDGDFCLWESNAIMQYLADQKSGPAIFPKDSKTRADISRWQFWQQAHWMQAVGVFLWENLIRQMAKAGAPDQAALKKAEENLHVHAKVLDGYLKGRQYLVGKEMTLADIAIVMPLMYLKEAKLPLADYRNIMELFGRVEKQDAWKKTIPKM